MADANHLGILKQGVEAWNEWMRVCRDMNPIFGPDLRRAHLSRENLFGGDFSKAILSGADLSRADLSKARTPLLGPRLYGGGWRTANEAVRSEARPEKIH